MQRIAADSGPLIALFNRHDRWNERILAWIETNPRVRLFTTCAVVTEVCALLSKRIGKHPQCQSETVGTCDSAAINSIEAMVAAGFTAFPHKNVGRSAFPDMLYLKNIFNLSAKILVPPNSG